MFFFFFIQSYNFICVVEILVRKGPLPMWNQKLFWSFGDLPRILRGNLTCLQSHSCYVRQRTWTQALHLFHHITCLGHCDLTKQWALSFPDPEQALILSFGQSTAQHSRSGLIPNCSRSLCFPKESPNLFESWQKSFSEITSFVCPPKFSTMTAAHIHLSKALSNHDILEVSRTRIITIPFLLLIFFCFKENERKKVKCITKVIQWVSKAGMRMQ